MIDFRYHVVSIVAVFLALAVGIVIGATSLRDELAGSLSGQVKDLRGELSTSREQVKESKRATGLQDDYAAAVAPQVLATQLTDRTVAVIVLPDTDDELVDATRKSLRDAGAVITTTVQLDDSWTTPKDSGRDAYLTSAATTLGMQTDTIPANRLAGQVLVETVAHGGSGGRVDPTASAVLRQLKSRDLAIADEDQPRQASAVVVLWPGMSTDGGDVDPVSRWADLITGMGLSGRPLVGVAAGPVGDDLTKPDALVTALRHSPEVTAAMSTVDDGSKAVGQAALVLALRDEYTSTAGQYGLDATASAVTPSLTAKK